MPLQENTPARWESVLADLTAHRQQAIKACGLKLVRKHEIFSDANKHFCKSSLFVACCRR
jgi:hypothetical protein